MTISPWLGIAWMALGLVMSVAGFTCSLVAQREMRLWLYAERYVAAELEVTRFSGKPRNSNAGCLIEGTIQPGGEQVRSSDRNLAIKQFISPTDRARNEPLPGEIEGQRLAVLHWPRRGDAERWWHPPNVVSPGEMPGAGAVVREVLLSGGCVGGALFCFRRGGRVLSRGGTSL